MEPHAFVDEVGRYRLKVAFCAFKSRILEDFKKTGIKYETREGAEGFFNTNWFEVSFTDRQKGMCISYTRNCIEVGCKEWYKRLYVEQFTAENINKALKRIDDYVLNFNVDPGTITYMPKCGLTNGHTWFNIAETEGAVLTVDTGGPEWKHVDTSLIAGSYADGT